MRLYLEAQEQIDIDQTIVPEFIRIDVTDLTEAKQNKVKKAIEAVMRGRDYKLLRHICGHDEQKSCIVEEVQQENMVDIGYLGSRILSL